MRQKNVQSTVHIVFLVAAMTYVQCFVLCFREEGTRSVTALYFGWPAFRHLGRRGGGLPPPPPLYSSLVTTLQYMTRLLCPQAFIH